MLYKACLAHNTLAYLDDHWTCCPLVQLDGGVSISLQDVALFQLELSKTQQFLNLIDSLMFGNCAADSFLVYTIPC